MNQTLKLFASLCSQTRLKNKYLEIEDVNQAIIKRLGITCVYDANFVKRRLLQICSMEELLEAGILTYDGTPMCSNGDINMMAFTDAHFKRIIFKNPRMQSAIPYNINGIESAKAIHIFRSPFFVAKALSQNDQIHAVGIHNVDILVQDWPKYFEGKTVVIRMGAKKHKLEDTIANVLKNTNTEVLIQRPGEADKILAVVEKSMPNQLHQLDPRSDYKKFGKPTPTHRWRTDRKGKYTSRKKEHY